MKVYKRLLSPFPPLRRPLLRSNASQAGPRVQGTWLRHLPQSHGAARPSTPFLPKHTAHNRSDVRRTGRESLRKYTRGVNMLQVLSHIPQLRQNCRNRLLLVIQEYTIKNVRTLWASSILNVSFDDPSLNFLKNYTYSAVGKYSLTSGDRITLCFLLFF